MWQQGALRDGSRSPPGVHQLHGDAVRVQVSTPDPGHALAPHEAAAGSQGITTTRAGPDGLPPQKGSRMQSPLMLTTRAADRLLDKGLAWFDGKGALLAYGTPYHWDAAQQCYVDLARLQAQREAALAPPPSPEVQAVQHRRACCCAWRSTACWCSSCWGTCRSVPWRSSSTWAGASASLARRARCDRQGNEHFTHEHFTHT